jgi:integral membrane protein
MDKLITLRVLAVVEATSFLALLVATIMKHTGQGDQGVAILGPIHGVLFLSFCAVTVSVSQKHSWSIKTTLLVLLGGVVPFGGYVVDRHFAREAA